MIRGITEAVLAGKTVIDTYDCWLMLIDSVDPKDNPLSHEIQAGNNYKTGGVPVGDIYVVAGAGGDIEIGWRCAPTTWVASDFSPSVKAVAAAYPKQIPSPQRPRWGIVYDKLSASPIVMIDLGGEFDMAYGDLTVKLAPGLPNTSAATPPETPVKKKDWLINTMIVLAMIAIVASLIYEWIQP